MRVTIIPNDKVITIDGVTIILDALSALSHIHAVQWDGQKGHVEFVQPEGEFYPNIKIEGMSDFQMYIDMAVAQIETPPAEAGIPLPMYTYKKRQQVAFTKAQTADFGVQYSDPQSIGLLTSLVAMFDKDLLTGKVNYKGPNGFIALDKDEMLALAAQVAAHVQKAFNAEKIILEDIEMGDITTYAEIDAAFIAAMA